VDMDYCLRQIQVTDFSVVKEQSEAHNYIVVQHPPQNPSIMFCKINFVQTNTTCIHEIVKILTLRPIRSLGLKTPGAFSENG